MTRPIDVSAIERNTGRTWPQWVALLDDLGAAELPHKEIARRLGDLAPSGWWAQSITVAYEQHIGRRVPGQNCHGEFSTSVTRTLPGTMDDALARWESATANRTDFDGVPVDGEPTVTRTDRWRYWRRRLADGTRVVVTISDKPGGRAGLAVTHEKLEARDDVDRWRAVWRAVVAELPE